MTKEEFCNHMEIFIQLIGDSYITANLECALKAYRTGVPEKGQREELQRKVLDSLKADRTGEY